jgi:hypothetical protein
MMAATALRHVQPMLSFRKQKSQSESPVSAAHHTRYGYNTDLTDTGLSDWDFCFQHQKFWVVDGVNVGWSTGNWDDADYPVGSHLVPPNTYPSIPDRDWIKTNRDFTVYVDSAPELARYVPCLPLPVFSPYRSIHFCQQGRSYREHTLEQIG